MFKSIKSYFFRLSVQAEIRAQTGDQNLALKLCGEPEIIELINQFYDYLKEQYGYDRKVAAFMTMFPVYSFALSSNLYSLEEKIRIATLINDADSRAKNNFHFYNNNAQIFLAAQSKMHTFCIKNDLDPRRLISNGHAI